MAENDRVAVALRGFGPIGILTIVVILFAGNITAGNMVVFPAGAVLALAWTARSHTPWRAIGYVPPDNWWTSLAAGVVLGSAFKIVMKAVVMPLLGAAPVNRTYDFLTGNSAMLPAAVWAMLVAGFGEETVFRGYLFERCARLFGCGAGARVSTVLLTSALFGLAHYADQGLAGAEQGAITGIAFGTSFALTGRLFPVMCAHAAFDLTALAILYWNLQSKVAHLVFR